MPRLLSIALSLALAVAVTGPFEHAAAQSSQASAKSTATKRTPMPKAGPGQKVCRYTFPTGEKRAWVCKKEEPCCAWDAISYVKCGSTITGCL